MMETRTFADTGFPKYHSGPGDVGVSGFPLQ